MTIPILQHAFSAGEISPSLYGRLDLPKWHQALSVGRNVVVSYKGGIFSRAGTAYVGMCKQAANASSLPPRIIEFSFNIFQSYILEFGHQYMRVVVDGAYVTETPLAITAVSTANPCALTITGATYSAGDDIFLATLGGIPQLSGITVRVIASLGGGQYSISSEFGAPINGALFGAYTGGGTAARIYTIATPYHVADLPYLKFVQSADTMSLTCVNQQTQTDYPPQELVRHAANNWTIAPPTFASSIGPPASCAATASVIWSTGPGPAAYGYVVTAVDAVTKQESVASPIGAVTGSVDIAGQFGTITVTWAAVTGAESYNIYRANPDYTNAGNFSGQFFGFAGSSNTTSWQDTNILPDFTTTPPLHINPFPSTGNYPGVVAYFQQRRGYAATLNAPDTYEFSQPGAYLDFDSAIPPIDSDAITGTPWAEQVNGVQWMLPMPGGLVIFTGKDAWQLSGTAGVGSPVTPAQQNAQAQESIGASPFLPPLKIGYNILYGQALGSIVRELNYNFYFNIYAGVDITVLSSHLFQGFTLNQWAYAQEPYKVIWCVRDDGKMLALTYVKDQQVNGWTRCDTNGLAVSVATASEPPVNAVYWIIKRFIVTENQWAYFLERMDNRLWANVEQCWCVDAGLSLPQPAPNATLIASAAQGTGGVLLNYVVVGGANYTAPVGIITDAQGQGQGALVTGFTLGAGGAITGVTIIPGTGYVAPQMQITDATGQGAVIALSVSQAVTFTATLGVFSAGNVGSVLRMGGGIATITQFVGAQQVVANVTKPITATVPNDPNNMPIPAMPGQWTMTKPVQAVGGISHLNGMTVSILADGSAVAPQVVVGSSVTLPAPASQITLGLPFIAQAQSMHADLGGEMIQGKRKRIQGVTVRMANSRGITLGQDQPIAAAQENQAELPWNVAPNLMTEIEDITNLPLAGSAVPLFTGDRYVSIAGDYNTTDNQPSPGMVAVQQTNPLGFEVTAFIPQVELGDVPN